MKSAVLSTEKRRSLPRADPMPDGLDEFKETVHQQMPEHHLLDMLKNVEHWVNYTARKALRPSSQSHRARHFTPPSGSDPKMTDAVSHYMFTVFGYAPFGHRRLRLTEKM